MATGIFGGTFDPIHLGHLAAAETALGTTSLETVHFMPAGDPWQKGDRTVSTATDRVAMVRIAIEPYPRFELDNREVDRGGSTYTVDTLETFDDGDVSLILGADAAMGLPTWHRAAEVRRRARILVVPRSSISMEDVKEVVPEAVFLEMDPVDVSATDIRRLASRGLPFGHLVPPGVADYIRSHDLYADVREDDMVEDLIEHEEQP